MRLAFGSRPVASVAVTYLFITNGELALCFLIRLCKCLELLDGLRLGHMETKLHVCLGVLVAGLDNLSEYASGELEWTSSNIRKPWYRRARLPMSGSKPCASLRHCPRRTGRILSQVRTVFTTAPSKIHRQRTANEEGISSENDALTAILHEVADAILRVTRGMQRADRDSVANLEFLAMCGCLGHRLAVAASDDGEFAELCQLRYISLEP